MYTQSTFNLILKLGEELREMYQNAPDKEKVTMIHLFGIKNGETILSRQLSISDIVEVAGIQSSYKTEVSKGIKLSKYVQLKANN